MKLIAELLQAALDELGFKPHQVSEVVVSGGVMPSVCIDRWEVFFGRVPCTIQYVPFGVIPRVNYF